MDRSEQIRLTEGEQWPPPHPDLSGVEHRATLPPRRLRRYLIASDVVAMLVGVAVAFVAQALIRPVPSTTVHVELALAALAVPIWIAVMGGFRLFTARVSMRASDEARHLVSAVFIGTVLLIAVAFVAHYDQLSRLWVTWLLVAVTLSLLVSRAVARQLFRRLRRDGRIRRRVLIVGTGCDAWSVYEATVRRRDLGYEVVGFVGSPNAEFPFGPPILGPVEQTCEYVRGTGVNGVILSVPSLEPDQVNRLTRSLTKGGCHVALSSALIDIDISRARSQEIDGRLMIYVEPNGNNTLNRVLKRAFDLATALVVIVLTMPLVVISAILIKIESSGPVIFSQVRVGRNGEQFRILKLRTMVADAEALRVALEVSNEADGPLFKMRSDPRVTRSGRFLRKTSIDELPQLWNVLRGEMSIVGPRPALPAELEQWPTDLHERTSVMPGITGLWQVSGRSDADFGQYQRWDLYYVDNWSLLHDLKIVLRTVKVVLFHRGAH